MYALHSLFIQTITQCQTRRRVLSTFHNIKYFLFLVYATFGEKHAASV